MDNNKENIKHLSYKIDNDILDEIKEIHKINTDEFKELYDKKYMKQIKTLNEFNSYVLSLIDPKSSLTDDKRPQRAFGIYSKLTEMSHKAYEDIKMDNYENISRILDNDLVIKAISDTDYKFKAYVDIRKNLDLLKTKITTNKDFQYYNSLFPTIDSLLKEVDSYIMSYMIFFFVMEKQALEVYKNQCKCNEESKKPEDDIVLYEATEDEDEKY